MRGRNFEMSAETDSELKSGRLRKLSNFSVLIPLSVHFDRYGLK